MIDREILALAAPVLAGEVEYPTDKQVQAAVTIANSLIDVGHTLKLRELNAWACTQYTYFDTILKCRKLRGH